MPRSPLPLSLLALALLGASSVLLPAQEAPRTAVAPRVTKITYPESKKVDQTDDYHGTKVEDPYRWLEDANSPETKAWVEAQNQVTFAYLRAIPSREPLLARLKELYDYEKFGVPSREGDYFFYAKNPGLANQPTWFFTKDLASAPTPLLDPNTLSADGTVSVGTLAVSPDGKHAAYGIQRSGSDWVEWKVREVATQKDLPDVVEWSKFSGASWTKDGKGFFYSRYDKPDEQTKLQTANYFQKVYFHRINTPQAEDVLAYERKDQKEWGFGGHVTEDGAYLTIRVTQGTSRKHRFFFRPLKDGPAGAPVVELIPDAEAEWVFLGNEGNNFYFRTDKDAPLGRIVALDANAGAAQKPREIVPQGKDALQETIYAGKKFVCNYLQDAKSVVRVFAADGKPAGEVKLPGIGTVRGFEARQKDTDVYFSFTGFTTPGEIHRLDLKTNTATVVFRPKAAFKADDFVTEQVFYNSKDGTRVPMFIVAKKGVKKDGSNPTHLYGYGGFNVAVLPAFSPANLAWVEKGGVYAVANLRGGSEYGQAWHEGGMKKVKQNVFDDFIAAGEWLVANQWTKPARLSIGGGSNGGLLVGATLNQRPDLFGAAVPQVGVMDMLRFQKFTIGWAWTSDYGSADDAEMFPVLRAYSPYHNLKPGGNYPAVLVMTSDHDDRVVPAHSFKYAAALQAAQAGDAPVLIRIETKSGHGAGRPTSKILEEIADKWAFCWRALGME